ncbi:piggyBac transposable element-derived protein 4-like [Anthonomus grandis grandis]|uniref:piggyBac transposable element-derived protein 4-like n=1 Tax=Anthonomus grandis grandis TaxID=2921223 RepID=UPI0021652036|nr:piggyBac transposable element-derived protein 4-like [Anthonomus grandis grandis]
MYYNNPSHPENSGKLYYIEEVMSCLKHTFSKARSESTFQSIDESMVKFKGRSALKQYLPLKPIKRGIKVWERCDSQSGYVYDINIYCGKEVDTPDSTLGQGLGERVVKTLCKSIKDLEVMVCFDGFFASVSLMSSIKFAVVSTCMPKRKNLPKFEDFVAKQNMKKGDSCSLFSNVGVAAYLWKDSKEVIVLSNYHSSEMETVERRQKDGTKATVPCPKAIKDYNSYMGGVDLSDQLSGLQVGGVL